MDERIPSPSSGEGKDDLRAATTAAAAATSTALVFRSGTYLVQLPKDQIYRVPPPENAVIAESLRNPVHRGRRSCCSVLQWILISVIVLGIVLATCSVVFSVALKPKIPTFFIEHFLFKNFNSSLHRHLQNMVEYDIRLRSENPNAVWGIDYQGEGGQASLSFGQQEIATGKPLGFLQVSKDTMVFQLVLNGSQRSMEGSLASNASVSLSLSMNLHGRLKFGVMRVWSLHYLILCDLRVKTLAKGAEILSQVCHVQV